MEYTKVFTAIILLGIAGVIEAQQGAMCHNEIITPSHNFNLSQFMGPWYGHAFAPGLAENLAPLSYKCYRLEFAPMNSENITLTQWYLDISNGSSTPVTETNRIQVTNSVLPAYWRWFPNDSNDVVSDTVYLHTDHRNWAVGYGCRIVDGYRYETFAVWTRTRFVDPIMTSVFKTLGEGYGFPSENLQFVEQGNCL